MFDFNSNFESDFKQKRILVTGGYGFLGKHVCQKLSEHGYAHVIAHTSEVFDLRRQGNISNLFWREDPEVVIHLAATVGGIGENKRRPADFLYDNAVMGLEMMKTAQQFHVKKFVQIGSACSYPEHAVPPFREEDLYQGYPEETSAPYGIAKRILLTYAQALREQYGFNAIYLIPTNMYGPGDNFNLKTSHVVPAIIRKFADAIKNHEDTVTLWGSGRATRDLLYVEDCAEAIIKALETYDEPEPVNIARGSEISIYDIALTIADLMAYHGRVEFDVTKPDGQPRRSLDVTRAKKCLDFQAETDIIEGLKATIDWYRSEKLMSDLRKNDV